MSYTVYTHGGGEYLRYVFNAIVAIMGGNDYVSLIKVAGIFGLLVLMFTAAFGAKPLRQNVQWFLFYTVLYLGFFVPKVTVIIVDRVLPNQSGTVVQGVPLGLGVFASYTSEIGDWLERTFDMDFALPGDINYENNGMIMGSNIMEASTQFHITNQNYMQSMRNFMQQCVFYDIYQGRYSWKDLMNAGNIWSFIGQQGPSPARAFQYFDYNTGAKSIVTCQAGYQKLTGYWPTEVSDDAKTYGWDIFTHEPSATAAEARLLAALPVDYQYMAHIAQTSNQIMQQDMMINVFKRALTNQAAKVGATASVMDLAAAQAQQQQRNVWALTGSDIGKVLPILRNAFEAILYAIFPIIFVFMLLPSGIETLGTYLKYLMWLQIWAPLYAVLNLLMTLYAADKTGVAAYDAGQVVAIANMGGIQSINANMAAIAGMLSASIPLFAWGLVNRTGFAMSQLASSVMAPMQQALGQAGAMATTGNIQLGNTSIGNNQWNNTTANQYRTSSMYDTGTSSYRTANGTMNHRAADGQTWVDQPLSHAAFNMQATQAVNKALSTRHSNLMTAAHNESQRLTHSVQRIVNQSTQVGSSAGYTAGKGLTNSQAITKTAQEATRDSVGNSMSYQKSFNQTAMVAASIGGSLGAGNSKLGVGVSGKAGISRQYALQHMSEQRYNQLATMLKQNGYQGVQQLIEENRHTLGTNQQTGFGDVLNRAADQQHALSEDLRQADSVERTQQSINNVGLGTHENVLDEAMRYLSSQGPEGQAEAAKLGDDLRNGKAIETLQRLVESGRLDGMSSVLPEYANRPTVDDLKAGTEVAGRGENGMSEVRSGENITADEANFKGLSVDDQAKVIRAQLANVTNQKALAGLYAAHKNSAWGPMLKAQVELGRQGNFPFNDPTARMALANGLANLDNPGKMDMLHSGMRDTQHAVDANTNPINEQNQTSYSASGENEPKQ